MGRCEKLKVEKAIGQWACLFGLPHHKISLVILTLETLAPVYCKADPQNKVPPYRLSFLTRDMTCNHYRRSVVHLSGSMDDILSPKSTVHCQLEGMPRATYHSNQGQLSSQWLLAVS